MMRSLALGLCAAAALALAGCSQNGGYRLSWSFHATPMGGPIESAAVGCGQHGVDSIFAAGMDETGDVIQVSAICTPGSFTGTAPNGLWSFKFYMINSRGMTILPPTAAVPPPEQTIASGGPSALFPITFFPLPSCSDGVDNDGDGLVDTTGGECAGGPGAPDGGSSGAQDSGVTGTHDGGTGAQDGGGAGAHDAGGVGAQDGGGAGAQDGGASGAQDGSSSGARG